MSAAPSSDSSQPRRKRPRADSSVSVKQSQQEETFRRDEQYWYEDGNIIIVAQGVGFRLYKGLLAQKSKVFCDMLSLPQPSSNSDVAHIETYDGCPVVYVTDSAAEISVLAYSISSGLSLEKYGLNFYGVASAVRIAHKYTMGELLEYSLNRLEEYIPPTYLPWEDTWLEDDLHPDRAITGVKLARLIDNLDLLPAALYICCQLDGSVLLEGWDRPGGSVDTLSPEDLALCIDGKTKLCARFAEVLFKIFAPITGPRSKPCLAAEGRCAQSLEGIRAASFSDMSSRGEQCAILRSWHRTIQCFNDTRGVALEHPLCQSCVDDLCARAETIREQSWSMLPELFDV